MGNNSSNCFIAPFSKLKAIQTSVALVIILSVVLLDYYIKQLSLRLCYSQSDIVLIPGILSFTYTTNDGAAWSILKGKQVFFVVLTVCVLVIVVFIYLKGLISGWLGIVSMAACVGGTIGNFIDRLRYGYVIDMFRTLFINFPIFNVADTFLTLGCIFLGVYILFFYGKTTE